MVKKNKNLNDASAVGITGMGPISALACKRPLVRVMLTGFKQYFA
jgi:hypothetical protein